MFKLRIRLLIPSLLVGLVLTGCCSARRAKPQTLAVRDNHTLFNPYWLPDPAGVTDRQPWPYATRTNVAEEVYYVGQLTDVQGRGHHDEDYLRARFTQIRTGHTRP